MRVDDEGMFDDADADAMAERLSRRFGLGEAVRTRCIPGIRATYEWESPDRMARLELSVDDEGARAHLHVAGRHVDGVAAMFGAMAGLPRLPEEGIPCS